jgi:tRNA U34 5-carboxymethylaminomethyl modifying GTPase MnmE/TrmE
MIKTRTPENIHHEIAHKLAKGVSYIDALIDYAREHDIEIETVAEIVKKSSTIKEKIRSEAVSMKMVKRETNDITQLCD